jgi:hypothetical protein
MNPRSKIHKVLRSMVTVRDKETFVISYHDYQDLYHLLFPGYAGTPA